MHLQAPSSITEFIDSGIQIGQINKVHLIEGTFIRIDGSPAERMPLALGVPSYIFDRRGTLIASTLDSGDDDIFMKRWNGLAWQPVTLQEAVALVNEEQSDSIK